MEMIVTATATIVAGLMAAYFLFRVHRLNSFRAAATKFRESVLKELLGLYPHPTQWPADITARLRGVFPALSASAEEFIRHLPKKEQPSFAQAWFNYHHGTGRDVDSNCYLHYITSDGSSGPHDGKKAFHENVSQLLSFAKQP
jgi:hypothetical protein